MSTTSKQLLVALVVILALGLGEAALAAFTGDPTPEGILQQMLDPSPEAGA